MDWIITLGALISLSSPGHLISLSSSSSLVSSLGNARFLKAVRGRVRAKLSRRLPPPHPARPSASSTSLVHPHMGDDGFSLPVVIKIYVKPDVPVNVHTQVQRIRGKSFHDTPQGWMSTTHYHHDDFLSPSSMSWDALLMHLSSLSLHMVEDAAAMLDMPNVLPWARALETDRAVYIQRQYLTASLYDRISTRPFLANIERKWAAFQLLRALADLHLRNVSPFVRE